MPTTDMLDEPSLSRQWLARRLQRALMLDTCGAALRRGIGRGAGIDDGVVDVHAASAEHRAATVAATIRTVGSEPYSSLRVSSWLATMAGRTLGLLGPWAWRSLLQRLADHTLSEYDALTALADGAPEAPEGLAGRLHSLVPTIEAEVESLR